MNFLVEIFIKMGRSKTYVKGGNKQIIICPCGWNYQGNSDKLKKIISLHSKKCSSNIKIDENIPNHTEYNQFYNMTNEKNYKAVQYVDGIPRNIEISKVSYNNIQSDK